MYVQVGDKTDVHRNIKSDNNQHTTAVYSGAFK